MGPAAGRLTRIDLMCIDLMCIDLMCIDVVTREDDAMLIRIVHGDITTQDVDAVVNAANTAMRGGGGVDGAIHRAGGPAVLADCIDRFPHGLETGQAGWTTAGNLAAQWVIHVVGPNYLRGQTDRALLTSCYANALMVADELGATSVAFPLVSAGIYGWPLPDAAAAAVETMRQTATQVTQARLMAYGEAAYDALTSALSRDARPDTDELGEG